MKKERHFFEDCVKVGDELWFSASRENALCTKNLRTGDFNIVYQFETFHRAMHLHSRVFYEEGILYFVPANADALAAYRIADRECRYFDIPKLRVYGIKTGVPFYHFESAAQIGRQLYMFSLMSPEITVFDMDKETMETVYIKELDVQNGAYHHTFGKDAAVWDGKLYLTLCGTPKLLELDTKSCAYRFWEYPVDTASFSCMAQDGGIFYIVDNTNADIICYYAGAGRFDLLKQGFVQPNTEWTFFKGIFWDQRLYLFQNYADDFCIYDIRHGSCEMVRAGSCPPEEAYLFCAERLESKYYAFLQTEKEIFFYYAPLDTVCRMDANGEVFHIPFLDERAKQELMMHRLSKVPDTDVYVEALPGDLELLVRHISANGKRNASGQRITVGECIYRELMKGIGK